jgi:hypothetical protein
MYDALFISIESYWNMFTDSQGKIALLFSVLTNESRGNTSYSLAIGHFVGHSLPMSL